MRTNSTTEHIRIGDTVTAIAPQDKHKTREIYLVTGKKKDKVSAQRLLHPLSDTPLKFMSHEYLSNPKHLRVVHRPETSPPSSLWSPNNAVPEETSSSRSRRLSPHPSATISKIPWSPINEKHYETDSDDDDDDKIQRSAVRVAPQIVLPITPPPSNLTGNIPLAQGNIPVPIEDAMDYDLLESEPESKPESLNLNLSDSDQDSVPEPSIDVTVDEDLEVPQHIIDLADMADEIVVDPSLDAEEYVQQFSPESQDFSNQDDPNLQAALHEPFLDVQQEEIVVPEVDLAAYLQSFDYDQHRLAQKKDTIFFYDSNLNDFVKVKIISKSNYRYYYNFKYVDLDLPKNGAYFRPGDYWSHTLPERRNPILQDVVPEDVPEVERGGSTWPRSRNVSPLASCSSIRTDQVCHLPKDDSFHLLSPRSKKKANQLHLAPQQEYMRSAIARSLAPSSHNPTPQARVGQFLEKIFLGKN